MNRLLAVILALLLLSSCSGSGFSVSEIRDLDPYSDKIEKYYRFYSDYTDAFIPSDKYGKVYPYIGGASDFGSYGGTFYLYGLCTADGGIVCDPVYRFYDSIRLGEHLFYIMVIPGVSPVPDSPYAHTGQDRYVLIRSDGRYCRILDGTPSIMVNGDYLQLQIDTLDFQFLDAQLEPYTGFVLPQWPDRYPSQRYYGTCPGCGRSVTLEGITRIHDLEDSYAFMHDYRLEDKVCFLTLDGEPITTIPHPGINLYHAELTTRYVFGTCQMEKADEYSPTAFIYLRDTEQFAEIPPASSISWLYDDVFLLYYVEDNVPHRIVLDLSEPTHASYDLVNHGGEDLLFTVANGISRTFSDGNEVICLRLDTD